MYFQVNVRRYFFLEVPCRASWSFFVIVDPRGWPVKYTLPEDQDGHDQEEEDVGGNQVEETIIGSHLDDDDLVLDVADAILDNL